MHSLPTLNIWGECSHLKSKKLNGKSKHDDIIWIVWDSHIVVIFSGSLLEGMVPFNWLELRSLECKEIIVSKKVRQHQTVFEIYIVAEFEIFGLSDAAASLDVESYDSALQSE